MRIITGEYKGRKLETPDGYHIRPTSDKVKEAVFSILTGNIYGSVCVDPFAGTGNLGLEALSRGAQRCYFGDNSRDSINLIKTNVKKCGAEKRSVILAGDFTRTLASVKEEADIIFLDPPYQKGLYEKCLEMIDSLDLLSEDGIIIAEHDLRDKLPESTENLIKVKERRYGKIMISIYRRKAEENG